MVTQILAQFTRQTGKQLYLHNAGGCELQGEVVVPLCLVALPRPRNYMIRLHGRRTGRNSTASQRQGCFLAVSCGVKQSRMRQLPEEKIFMKIQQTSAICY